VKTSLVLVGTLCLGMAVSHAISATSPASRDHSFTPSYLAVAVSRLMNLQAVIKPGDRFSVRPEGLDSALVQYQEIIPMPGKDTYALVFTAKKWQ
jgi:hypothetical protein